MSIDLSSKTRLVEALERHLNDEMERATESQRATQDGATHSENKQESDKDTRAIEAGYLARGLSMRVESLAADIARLKALPIRVWADDEPAGLGAWVAVDDATADGVGTRHYFLAPVGGGVKLTVAERGIRVVTPRSPMGQALVGRSEGDDVAVITPGGKRLCEVVGVY